LERIEKQRLIDGNASPGLLIQKARLGELLDQVTIEIRKSSAKLAALTTGAQDQAVNVAQDQAAQYPRLTSDLNFFDSDAARKLIGLAGDGEPLAVHFAKLVRPARQAMFDALFYGISVGLPNVRIAREVQDSIGGTRAQAMTIVRTETNRAYREATREFYDDVSAVIGWRWLAALDLRTCPICWALHGRIFKTKTKFGTHPNCRCTMVPVFAGDPKFETGPEVFNRLTRAQQLAILGPGRLGLYNQGAELSDFVENRKSAFGIGRAIKPLERTKFKPRPRNPEGEKPPRPIVDRTTPEPASPPAIAPKSAPPFNATKIRTDFVKQATTSRAKAKFVDPLPALRTRWREIANQYWDVDSATRSLLRVEREQLSTAIDAARKELEDVVLVERQMLKVENGVKVEIDELGSKGSFPKTKPDRRRRVNEVRAAYETLVDAKAWPAGTKIAFRQSTARANYWDRVVKVNLDTDNERGTIAHEIAHGLEILNKDNLRQANEFLDYRTPGERPISLKKLLPRSGYGTKEKARPDKFQDAYVGKIYGEQGKQYATEVISMGVQYLYENPLQFAEADPEYFEFILHIVRGEKWLAPK
jgi:SPP1 gp7 family putative phage head morphogenesis protein